MISAQNGHIRGTSLDAQLRAGVVRETNNLDADAVTSRHACENVRAHPRTSGGQLCYEAGRLAALRRPSCRTSCTAVKRGRRLATRSGERSLYGQAVNGAGEQFLNNRLSPLTTYFLESITKHGH